MFESELEQKFKNIFDVKKVTFAGPGESMEQECLFVEITNPGNIVKDSKVLSKIEGNAVLFCYGDKVPFGFFSKKIKEASSALTKDFFFSEIEANRKMSKEIVARSFNFIYFFQAQYDPENGEINELEFIDDT